MGPQGPQGVQGNSGYVVNRGILVGANTCRTLDFSGLCEGLYGCKVLVRVFGAVGQYDAPRTESVEFDITYSNAELQGELPGGKVLTSLTSKHVYTDMTNPTYPERKVEFASSEQILGNGGPSTNLVDGITNSLEIDNFRPTQCPNNYQAPSPTNPYSNPMVFTVRALDAPVVIGVIKNGYGS